MPKTVVPLLVSWMKSRKKKRITQVLKCWLLWSLSQRVVRKPRDCTRNHQWTKINRTLRVETYLHINQVTVLWCSELWVTLSKVWWDSNSKPKNLVRILSPNLILLDNRQLVQWYRQLAEQRYKTSRNKTSNWILNCKNKKVRLRMWVAIALFLRRDNQ